MSVLRRPNLSETLPAAEHADNRAHQQNVEQGNLGYRHAPRLARSRTNLGAVGRSSSPTSWHFCLWRW